MCSPSSDVECVGTVSLSMGVSLSPSCCCDRMSFKGNLREKLFLTQIQVAVHRGGEVTAAGT